MLDKRLLKDFNDKVFDVDEKLDLEFSKVFVSMYFVLVLLCFVN